MNSSDVDTQQDMLVAMHQQDIIETLNQASEMFARYSKRLDVLREHGEAVGILRALMSQGEHCPTEAIDKAIARIREIEARRDAMQ